LSFRHEASLGERLGEAFLFTAELAGIFGPAFPGAPEVGTGFPGVDVGGDAGIEPEGEDVFAGEVVIGGVTDGVGWPQATALPLEAAIYGPAEYGGPFGFELLGEIEVALWFWDCDSEGDEVQAAADGLVDAAERRLVIADDHELELGVELEEVLAHIAALEAIAAGEFLKLSLGPGLADFDFAGDGEAAAAQAGDLCRVAFGVRDHEHIGADGQGVAMPNTEHGINEHGLTVSAAAVEEEHGVFFDRAGEAIAGDALEVVLECLVIVGDAGEELGPQGVRGAGWGSGHGSNLGDVVAGVRRFELSRSEVAIQFAAEHEGVGVPLVDGCGEAWIATGEVKDCCHRLG
jgi:hypothetical protein